ncbi:MAG: PriCT-2 domain-containing protein [Candidatus Desulfofervidaceae bacterium]|nr:PriCT-2 domain-containing protein [Candidatus Desulfofervidaceae bacterium]
MATNSKTPAKHNPEHPHSFAPLVQFSNIPEHIKLKCKWCVWKAKPRPKQKGKFDKIPYGHHLTKLKTNQPDNWLTYKQAKEHYLECLVVGLYNGVGILVENCIIVDIDGGTTNDDWDGTESYAEYSPSGSGIHLIGTSNTPLPRDMKNPYELYGGSRPRMMTVTGDITTATPVPTNDIGVKALAIIDANVPPPHEPTGNAPPEWKPEAAISALKHINPDIGYNDGWLTVCMGLHHSSGGSAEGLQILKGWSAGSDKYNEAECIAKWRSFGKGASTDAVVTISSIYGMAHDNGWDNIYHDEENDIILDFAEYADTESEFHKSTPEWNKVLTAIEQPWIKNIVAADMDYRRLKDIYTRAIFNPKASKILYLNSHGVLNEYTVSDFIPAHAPINSILGKLEGEGDFAAYYTAATRALINGIKKYRQVTGFKGKTDMFANKPRLHHNSNSNIVNHICIHKPFKTDTEILDTESAREVIADYEDHFPQLYAFIRAVSAARFANNRREAYLWLNAGSNWGKGFLITVFQKLDIIADVSEKEIEAVYEGKPCGIEMDNMHKVWILLFDEFKTVKSEIKRLDSTLTGRQIYGLKMTVDIYYKLFMSAENVDSMTGLGVESQFVNRFSCLSGDNYQNDMANLATVKKYGENYFFKIIKNHVARCFNTHVQAYRKLGRINSVVAASVALKAFHLQHNIAKHHGHLDDVFPEYAAKFNILVNKISHDKECGVMPPLYEPKLHKQIRDNITIVYSKCMEEETLDDWCIALSSHRSIMGSFLREEADESTRVKLAHKKGDVLKLCTPIKYMDKNRVSKRYGNSKNWKTEYSAIKHCVLIEQIRPEFA